MTIRGIEKLISYQKAYFPRDWKFTTTQNDLDEMKLAYMDALAEYEDEDVLMAYLRNLKNWGRMPGPGEIMGEVETSERAGRNHAAMGEYRCAQCGMPWNESMAEKVAGRRYCRECGAEVREGNDPFDAIPRGMTVVYKDPHPMSLDEYIKLHPYSAVAKNAGMLGDMSAFGMKFGSDCRISLEDLDAWIRDDKRVGHYWEAIKRVCRIVVEGEETEQEARERIESFMSRYCPGYKTIHRPAVSGFYWADDVEF